MKMNMNPSGLLKSENLDTSKRHKIYMYVSVYNTNQVHKFKCPSIFHSHKL